MDSFLCVEITKFVFPSVPEDKLVPHLGLMQQKIHADKSTPHLRIIIMVPLFLHTDCIELVDWAGRQFRGDKQGHVNKPYHPF